jgi:hypothetical protein
VHKISAYKYIYENGKKKWEKEKEKEFSASWAGGDFGLAQRRRARARGRRPSRPTRSVYGAADAVGAGPHARERKGETTLGGEEAGPRWKEPVAGDPDGGSSPVVRF